MRCQTSCAGPGACLHQGGLAIAFRSSGHGQLHSKRLRNTRRTALLALTAASPAEARIECRGNFQVTKYDLISTPYCEEEEIARVARSYGHRVSGAEVRNNPLKKVYLCQIIGDDVRC
jgi:hypothetical protein